MNISINGYRLDHDIVLTRSDIPGVQNVDNTPDLQKPISISTQSALDEKQSTSEKDSANGYAGLNSVGKLNMSVFPVEYMKFIGTWDASVNDPDLSSTTTVDSGSYYVVSASGNQMNLSWNVYDVAIFDGVSWHRVPYSSRVESVNDKTGTVQLTASDIGLDQVDNTSDMSKPVSSAQLSLIDSRTLAPADGSFYALQNNVWSKIENGISISCNNSNSPLTVSNLMLNNKQMSSSLSSGVLTLNVQNEYDGCVYSSGMYRTVKSAVDAQCKNILIIENVEEDDLFAITYNASITLNPGVVWTCKGLSVQTSNILLKSHVTSKIVWSTVTPGSFITGSSSLAVHMDGHVVIDLQQQQQLSQSLFSNVTSIRVNGVFEILFGDSTSTLVEIVGSSIDTLVLRSMSLDGSSLYGVISCSYSDIDKLEIRGRYDDRNSLISLDKCWVSNLHIFDFDFLQTNGYHLTIGGEVSSLHNDNDSNRIYVKVNNDKSIFTNAVNTFIDVNSKQDVMISASNVYISNANSTTVTSCIVTL